MRTASADTPEPSLSSPASRGAGRRGPACQVLTARPWLSQDLNSGLSGHHSHDPSNTQPHRARCRWLCHLPIPFLDLTFPISKMGLRSAGWPPAPPPHLTPHTQLWGPCDTQLRGALSNVPSGDGIIGAMGELSGPGRQVTLPVLGIFGAAALF